MLEAPILQARDDRVGHLIAERCRAKVIRHLREVQNQGELNTPHDPVTSWGMTCWQVHPEHSP